MSAHPQDKTAHLRRASKVLLCFLCTDPLKILGLAAFAVHSSHVVTVCCDGRVFIWSWCWGPNFRDRHLRKIIIQNVGLPTENKCQLCIPRKQRKIGVWVSGAEIQTSAVDTRTAVWVSTAEKIFKIVLGETRKSSRMFRGVSAPALYENPDVMLCSTYAVFLPRYATQASSGFTGSERTSKIALKAMQCFGQSNRALERFRQCTVFGMEGSQLWRDMCRMYATCG